MEVVPRLSRCPGAAPSLYFHTCTLRRCQPGVLLAQLQREAWTRLLLLPPLPCPSRPFPADWRRGRNWDTAGIQGCAQPQCPGSDEAAPGALAFNSPGMPWCLGEKGQPRAPQELCEAVPGRCRAPVGWGAPAPREHPSTREGSGCPKQSCSLGVGGSQDSRCRVLLTPGE